MYKYYITGYNQRKLNGEVSEDERERIGDKYPKDIIVHILRNCELLKHNTTGIEEISFKEELPRWTNGAIPFVQNDKEVFCCSKCYSDLFGLDDMRLFSVAARKKIEEDARKMALRKLGLSNLD